MSLDLRSVIFALSFGVMLSCASGQQGATTSDPPQSPMQVERAGIPVLGFFTDYHTDYHRAGDVVARINFPGLETIVDLSERVIRAIADGSERPHRR
jgi:hypothetical protein